MKTVFIIGGILLIITGLYYLVIGISNYMSKQIVYYLQKNKSAKI